MENSLLSERLIYNGESETPTHLHLCVYDTSGEEEYNANDFNSIAQSLNDGKMNWLQVHGIKDIETIRDICRYFKIDFLVLQDILDTTNPTKVEIHDDYTVVILKLFKKIKSDDELDLIELEPQQICLILGENYLLTFIECESEFFSNVNKAIKKDALKIRKRPSDYLLSVLIGNVITHYISIVTDIDERLEDLEDVLFTATDNKDMGKHIQSLRREYMAMKKVVMPLKEQYLKLLRGENDLIHKSTRAFFNDVNDHILFVLQTVDICRETLASLVDLYISNNDLRMNEIMKRLTVVSTIFIPLTFLVGVWGMNFNFMPELTLKYGYFIAWGVIIVTAVVISIYLRRKKWL